MLLFLSACSGSKPLATVVELDLQRYAGVWYEIERLPNSFEKGLSCVQASYALNPDGSIVVENHGYGPKGWKKVKGSAVQKEFEKPGEIKVTFYWPFYGDYFILELDKEYQYALVGSPSRKYLWILARQPEMPEERIMALKQKAQSLGFDTSTMERISHQCPDEEEKEIN